MWEAIWDDLGISWEANGDHFGIALGMLLGSFRWCEQIINKYWFQFGFQFGFSPVQDLTPPNARRGPS